MRIFFFHQYFHDATMCRCEVLAYDNYRIAKLEGSLSNNSMNHAYVLLLGDELHIMELLID